MDPIIVGEMKDHIYLNLPAFFTTLPTGLDSLVDAVFGSRLQHTSYTSDEQLMECITVVMR